MRTKKILLVMLIMAMVSGCARWHDKDGNILSKNEKFECEKKCSYYESNKGPYKYDACFEKCMEKKGYTKY